MTDERKSKELSFLGSIVLGIFASLAVAIIFYICTNHLISGLLHFMGKTRTSFSWTLDLCLLISVFTFLLAFKNGLRLEDAPEYIPQNHRGLLLLFGRRLQTEVGEGIFWWLWPRIGGVDIHDMRKKTLTLAFGEGADHSSLNLPDGSQLKQAHIDIRWQLKPGRLYDISTLEDDPETYLRSIAGDRARTGSNIVVSSISQDELRSRYRNIGSMALISSLSRWKNVICYGLTFRKPHSYSGESTLAEGGMTRLKELGEDLPLTGLLDDTSSLGITVHEVNILDTRLPDTLIHTINAQLAEETEKGKETEETKTLLALSDMIIENSTVEGEPTISRSEALNKAMAMQGKIDIKINIVDGHSDPIARAAAIFNANQ